MQLVRTTWKRGDAQNRCAVLNIAGLVLELVLVVDANILCSKYAQYHPTHGKPWPGGLKIIFQEYAEANHCENPQLPHEMCTLAQDRKAWSVWRSTVGTTRNPHERLSQAESGGGAKACIY